MLKKKILAAMLAGSFMFFGMGGTINVAESATQTIFYGGRNLKEIKPAKSFNENPFGLVYSGAITENVSGKVTIHTVTYELNGIKIMANIYTPANYDAGKKYPAIVVAHPNGGVKEQVAGLYAQRLAENGYITIAADAAFQGASGGEPRHLDNPAFRVEDIHGMADVIANYPGVDADRIGALGICGGGGYTLKAAQTDKRLKAVATLSAFNSGIVRKDGFMNSAKDTTIKRLQEASEQRAKEVSGGEIALTANVLDMEISDAELAKMPTLYSDGYIYYGKTHRHPNSTFAYTVRSNLDLFTFNAAHDMDLINQPLLMVAGSEADTLYMTEECFKNATGTTNKEIFLVDGATHIKTYWVPEYVEKIVNKFVEFYGKNL